MTLAGWIIMIISTGLVSLLFAWCIYKVIKTPGESERLHGIEQGIADKDL